MIGGAPIAWNTALLHPDKVCAVAGLSVPYTGLGPEPFIEVAKKVYADQFFIKFIFADDEEN